MASSKSEPDGFRLIEDDLLYMPAIKDGDYLLGMAHELNLTAEYRPPMLHGNYTNLKSLERPGPDCGAGYMARECFEKKKPAYPRFQEPPFTLEGELILN